MKAYDIILKKRDGEALSREEIEFMVLGYAQGEIPDYQMSAFLMAVFIKSMTPEETRDLTQAMTNSGHIVELSGVEGIKADKHSTGGVGDTTTLLIGPIVAAAGIPFAKMSGRGLGHTGGTIDKLEAIPGYKLNLTEEEFLAQVKKIGIAVISPTGDIAPADKKMYALRDVTATVDNIPLIAGSIMSKKLASGADVILLDVKVGSGAFMKTEEDARELARTLVQIGKLAGKNTRAVITDMNQPLNSHIGNALEVREVIEILKGERPDSALRAVSVTLSGHIIQMTGLEPDLNKAIKMAEDILVSGKALEKMRELLIAQAGSADVIEDLSILPSAKAVKEIYADTAGYIESVDVLELGIITRDLGGGRFKKEDAIDYGVGLILDKRVASIVNKGDKLGEVYAKSQQEAEAAALRLKKAVKISENTRQDREILEKPLILDVIG